MKKMAVAVIVSAALAGGYFYFQGTSHAAHTPAPSSRVISVTTGTVGSHSIAQSLSLIGKLQAEQAVTIASEVAAKVKSIEVKPNTRVQKGALLLQLEDDKARAAYNEALAYRNDESRKLNDFKRLISRGAITQTELEAQTASVNIAEARLQAAKAHLSDLSIRAPFNGTVGLYDFSIGHMVPMGGELFSFDDLSSMRLDIQVPEQYLASLQSGMKVNAKSQAWPDRTFSGTVQTIDSRVQADSLNVKVRVTFNNSDNALKPGMLLAADMGFMPHKEALIPVQALEYSGTKRYVYVVDENNIAHRTQVELGARVDNEVVIKSGVNIGEKIVVQGLVNMRDGMKVKDLTAHNSNGAVINHSRKAPSSGVTS
ncbi:efflux RND transporter periplasmic adaptor subunit [Photobacterium damselae subsp. piscicida]|uniref:Multidrug resistance protein MdtA n=1 Tax=Photobacterium damsela subsp. piscicida TaxID=38294 RepID=A0AAD1FPI4_PHODP|nr:efflux RND transporter periplasmic adaptor subunit [Photobacterium damselae]MBE8128643.1 efflux RND transporter periplasmic adaptor subunit [Photobacterium damselae subsp. piscicida]PSV75801.1 efflux RND transporter periplasmic adaptor subunit [Photobacterium damselae]PSW78459.1 efflux RND transporter periplasmic adaptor subunit [Photobacterium damselae]TFZ60129.1 efflux RND transporter periplasmic adaptor subunit [Photobacterium damselae subsp. piscicida]TJZ86040.1 efflux RND transporter p